MQQLYTLQSTKDLIGDGTGTMSQYTWGENQSLHILPLVEKTRQTGIEHDFCYGEDLQA